MNVLVIGAGPAGLTAGYELSKQGISATLLEADDHVGGLARTVNYRGYRFDIGGHRFFTKVPLIQELWHEILGEELLLRPRLSRIQYRGRLFDYPLKPLNALAGLGIWEAVRVCLSYAQTKVFPWPDESTFEHWVANRFGTRLYEIFFKTYTEKVWGIPCSQISADWATQRIRNLSLGEALRNALFKSSKDGEAEVVTSLIEQFHYPRFGPGMMWERCAELVTARGARLCHRTRVDRLRHHKGRVERVEARSEQGERLELHPDQVISSMPVRDLIQALDPPPPPAVQQAAAALQYRDYLSVVLIVNRAQVFADNWIYIHTPEVRVGRVQNYKNWSECMVADPRRTSLGLEYFLWDHDEHWGWPAERLIELGIRELAQIGLIEAGEVEDGTVVRMPKAYPVYDRFYAGHLATIRDYLAGIENLQTIGRNGQHRYNNQDHSMLAGVYAARNLFGARHDLWAVNTDGAYLEEARPAARLGERLVPTPLAPSLAARLSPQEIIAVAFARLDPVALGCAFAAVAGLALLAASATALFQESQELRRWMALLSQYLIGYRVSWSGLWIGVAEAALVAFAVGYFTARLRNGLLTAYAALLRRRAARAARRHLLDEV
jgi:protoporphyrinogen oxidase